MQMQMQLINECVKSSKQVSLTQILTTTPQCVVCPSVIRKYASSLMPTPWNTRFCFLRTSS